MTERPNLRSVSHEMSHEVSPKHPTWQIHMELYAQVELDLQSARQVSRDIERRYPGSFVATKSSRAISISLAVSEEAEPSIETMLRYGDKLRGEVESIVPLGYSPDSVPVATPIKSSPETNVVPIGRTLVGEVTYPEQARLSIVPSEKNE